MNTKVYKTENKIPNTSKLVTAAVLNTKINKIKIKISAYAKYITTHESKRLTAENLKKD